MGVLDGKVAIVTGTSRGVGVGIAHELLRAGATVIGCSRSPLDAIARRGRRARVGGTFRTNGCAIRAITTRSTPSSPAWSSTYGRIDILVNNAGGTVPRAARRGHSRAGARIQGAPRSDDDFERTVLFHAFAIQMNLISPMWFAIRVYRQMRTQDGIGCDHQHLQRRGPSGGLADAGVLRRGEVGAQPPHPVARRGVGPDGPGQLSGAGADDDRQLPGVRAAHRRPDRQRRTSTTCRSGVAGEPARSAARVCSLPPAQPITSMAPPSKSTAACCPACSTTPA